MYLVSGVELHDFESIGDVLNNGYVVISNVKQGKVVIHILYVDQNLEGRSVLDDKKKEEPYGLFCLWHIRDQCTAIY